MIVASASGGMEIEEIAESQPDSIIRATVDPGRRACRSSRRARSPSGSGSKTA